MTILRILLISPAYVQNAGYVKDECSASVAVGSEVVPEWGDRVAGGRLIVVLDEWSLFESGQILQVGDLVSEQVRRNYTCERHQDICDIVDELVVGKF